MPSEKLKIVVKTEPADWHGMSSERMWASALGGGRYRIENYPFHVYGISFGDVVMGSVDSNNVLHFDRVVIKSGHSNYRVLLSPGKNKSDFLSLWQEIQALGCYYESTANPENIFAIDVPPSADVVAVYKVLEKGEMAGIWRFDEGNYEHPAVAN